MILAPDSPPVHLPSHSSTKLLLRTTLPFTDNPVPTLVDSSATNNFINESLVALAPHSLLHLPAPIPLKLFDGDPTPVFPALVDSGTSGTFVSNQLGLHCNDLNKPLELQLFNGNPAMTRITQYHNNTLTLNNDLQFQAWLLVTQLPLPTPIVLGLPWLQDVNPNINWKNLTMRFPGPEASLAAAIPLRLQSILDSDISHPGTSTSGATQSPSTSNDNPNKEGDATLPWSLSITL
ncbi:hypothetical protein C0989_005493 [Termitomyces sp. Mn162]|nr:hypothetical protein C0989_005493 [Termitomyces sp. Mn162]